MTETIQGAIARVAQTLRAAGIDAARLEGRLLVEAVTEASPSRDRTLAMEEAQRLNEFVERRLRREPVALIVGEREFWSLAFRVTLDTLVPRPESETLVQEALAWAKGFENAASVLDLGTGSGCLLLSVLSERRDDRGVGVDINREALAVAESNAHRLGLTERSRFVTGDWGTGLMESFDVVLANPPYVSDDELAELMPEVARYEPRLALAGGMDGLDPYRHIARQARRLVTPRGALFLELSPPRAEATTALFEAEGFRLDHYAKDLAGHRRCVVLTRR